MARAYISPHFSRAIVARYHGDMESIERWMEINCQESTPHLRMFTLLSLQIHVSKSRCSKDRVHCASRHVRRLTKSGVHHLGVYVYLPTSLVPRGDINICQKSRDIEEHHHTPVVNPSFWLSSESRRDLGLSIGKQSHKLFQIACFAINQVIRPPA